MKDNPDKTLKDAKGIISIVSNNFRIITESFAIRKI